MEHAVLDGEPGQGPGGEDAEHEQAVSDLSRALELDGSCTAALLGE